MLEGRPNVMGYALGGYLILRPRPSTVMSQIGH